MNMKKIAPLAMSVLLLSGTAVFANDSLPVQENEERLIAPNFISVSGIIDSKEVRGEATYYFSKEMDNPFYIVVSKDTLVFDNEGNALELKVGDSITAHMYANTSMIAIYPPQYSPKVVIVDTGSASLATVGTFNGNLFDVANSIKLNISDEQNIVDEQGNKIEVSGFKGGDAVVFSTISTMSFPAQLPPTKIVVIAQEEDTVLTAEDEIFALIKKDMYEVNGKTMVPLRRVAEYYSFKVEYTGKGAIISKGALTYTVTLGEKKYGHNRALRQFTEAPALLEKYKTYVELDFAVQLVK